MNQLREVKSGDKDQILEWRNSPEIAKYMYTDRKITAEEHEKWFQSIQNDIQKKIWIIQCDGEDVGVANLYDIDTHNKRCYWAFYIASPNIRGKGVGSFVEYSILTYVFEELKLNKLCCEVLGFNEPVVNMHKKFGFKQEGLFRQHCWKEGVPQDVHSLAILRGEWLAIQPDMEQHLKAKNIL